MATRLDMVVEIRVATVSKEEVEMVLTATGVQVATREITTTIISRMQTLIKALITRSQLDTMQRSTMIARNMRPASSPSRHSIVEGSRTKLVTIRAKRIIIGATMVSMIATILRLSIKVLDHRNILRPHRLRLSTITEASRAVRPLIRSIRVMTRALCDQDS